MDSLPNIAVTLADGSSVKPSDYQGKPFVLYFYPKADTTGCTREAQDFTALGPQFKKLGVTVLGISKDPPKKLEKFRDKYDLGVLLGSDESGALCEAMGVWGEKKLYGRVYMGIERATFLFSSDGKLAQSWRKVKVADHAQQVLEAAKALG